MFTNSHTKLSRKRGRQKGATLRAMSGVDLVVQQQEEDSIREEPEDKRRRTRRRTIATNSAATMSRLHIYHLPLVFLLVLVDHQMNLNAKHRHHTHQMQQQQPMFLVQALQHPSSNQTSQSDHQFMKQTTSPSSIIASNQTNGPTTSSQSAVATASNSVSRSPLVVPSPFRQTSFNPIGKVSLRGGDQTSCVREGGREREKVCCRCKLTSLSFMDNDKLVSFVVRSIAS